MSPNNRDKQRQYHRNLPIIMDKQEEKYYQSDNNDTTKRKEFSRMKNLFSSQKYNTMPNNGSKQQNEFAGESLPVRSVTPDLTRQLDNTGHLWNCNNLQQQNQINRKTRTDTCNYDLKNHGHGHDSTDGRQILMPSNTQNRYFSPLGIPALGYRFFASTPVNTSKEKSRSIETLLNHSPIVSSIAVQQTTDNRNLGTITVCRCPPNFGACMCFSSRVSGNYHIVKQNTRDFHDTMENHCEKKNTNDNVSQPIKKSTMSNDELFAAIYKSKRKLNIKNDEQEIIMTPDNNKSVSLHRAGSRHSWSPESQNIIPEVSQWLKRLINYFTNY